MIKMNVNTIANILLLASLFLLSPMVEDQTEVLLLPEAPLSIAVKIYQPEIIITSSINGTVEFNVTYFDASNNSNKSVALNGELNFDENSGKISADRAGFYIFDLVATNIGKVKIKSEGIYFISWFFIAILISVRLGIFIKYQYY
ncbi:MAG: hypothetical protein ACW99A_19040 [Candidatus Kariarchaeaceae archaeon]